MSEYGQGIWDEVDKFLKRAEEASTSHPSGKVEDDTQPAAEGSRASENAADIKAHVHNSVDAAPANINSGDGASLTNTTAKPTGEDPSSETSSVKTSPTDPGTSHPAKVGDEKYASLINLGSSIQAAIAVAGESAKQAAAKAAAGMPPALAEALDKKKDEKKDDSKPSSGMPPQLQKALDKKAEEGEAAKEEKKEEDKKEESSEEAKSEESKSEEKSEEEKAAELAGREAARLAIEAIEKQAQAVDGEQIVQNMMKTASSDAENVAEYLLSFQTAKSAMDGAMPVDGGAMPPEMMEAAMAQQDPAMGAPAQGGADELMQLLIAAIQAGEISPEEVAMALQSAAPAPVEAAPAMEAPKMASLDRNALVQAIKSVAAKK